MNKKIFIILIFMIILVGCGKKDKAIETNFSSIEFKEEQIDNFLITNSKIYKKDEYFVFKAELVNISYDDYYVKKVLINIYDETEKKISEISSFVVSVVQGGDTKDLNVVADFDLSSAKKIKYEIIYE